MKGANTMSINNNETSIGTVERRRISFSITGEWLTDYIRRSVMYEEKNYEWAKQTLAEILAHNGLDEKRIVKITQDVLLGRGRFTGETRDGTFAYDDDTSERPDDFFSRFCRVKEELSEEKKYCEQINGAWLELCAYMTGEIGRDDLSHTMNAQFKIEQSLKEFIKRATDEEVAESEPYGFIAPDGEFHRVEWGEHGEWAETYITTSGLYDDFDKSPYSYPADFLVHSKGWLLLHNPSNSRPKLTVGAKPMTKAQRESLYDYYIKAGRNEEANAIFREER